MAENWKPNYQITPQVASWLMRIESIRTIIQQTPFSPAIAAELRYRARMKTAHYSTAIEGNRLTLDQAQQVIQDSSISLTGFERDEIEVRNVWSAQNKIGEWALQGKVLDENLIHRIHAFVDRGITAQPSSYRVGHSMLEDGISGEIRYLPPHGADVPELMLGLINWINDAGNEDIPVPIIAALTHYQIITLCPYRAKNHLVACLLAAFILFRGGYSSNGLVSLEENYARDREGYAAALAVPPHNTYYAGKALADLTSWSAYYIHSMVSAFTSALEEAQTLNSDPTLLDPEHLRRLDERAKIVLKLFLHQETVTNHQVAGVLHLSERMARVLIKTWVEQGWLTVVGSSRRDRNYSLTDIYRQFVAKNLK